MMHKYALPFVFCMTVHAMAQGQPTSLETLEQKALRAAADQVADCVVQIETIGGSEKVGKLLVGAGPTTGLIVSEDGLIVSDAFSFAQDPTSILVTLPDGKRRPAKIISRDNSRMLVLLKVDTDTALRVPDAASIKEVNVGEWAVAVGRTFSPSNVNISVGIVSAKDRVWGKAIQTDAKISPANYGGPLVNLRGQVLGVLVPLSVDTELYDARGKRIPLGITAGHEWYDSGIGFAIPFEDILTRLPQLQKAELFRGRMGISMKGSAIGSPAVVAAVQVNSPAADIGLKPGDQIVEANQVKISRQAELRHVLGPLYGGDKVELVVMRGDQRLEFAPMLVDVLPIYEHPFLGILPAREDSDTVNIRWVYPNGPAAKAGLKAGDKLLKFNQQAIQGVSELRDGCASIAPGKTIDLEYRRDGETRTAEVTLATLPTEIPTDLPPTTRDSQEANAAATGEIKIEIPEEANACVAYVPNNYDPSRPYGLLVALHPPGASDHQAIIENWKEACQTHDLILLMPKAEKAERWQPTEEAFIRKTIDECMNRYNVDPTRVVVEGYQGGAAMAYLSAFKHRDLIRGVIAVDSALPLRIGQPQNDPIQRLAILTAIGKKSKLYERVSQGVEQLREVKFPVTVLETGDEARALTPQERQEVAKWIDALDRI
ncbi:MAG: PDZ domain-containing protein [Planctomycetaceae bacterium]|nr:PDZ domain-containing protein [Planctomycetaceae bacterium]